MKTRGVILAGGRGVRLGELTRVTNKHLLPVGPYPMVYYPIKKLVGAGVRDILLVSGTEHVGAFVELLGSGREHGCDLTYRVQDEAGGIAQALGLAEGFAAGARVVVLLGDNVFQEPLGDLIVPVATRHDGDDWAWVFLKRCADPRQFGVAEVHDKRIVSIEEKPDVPRSDLAVTGIYSYPPDVYDVIRSLEPSVRGELEVTDVNRHYLERGRLDFQVLTGYWTDAGTPTTLDLANIMVRLDSPKY